jgi:hypothetical protein
MSVHLMTTAFSRIIDNKGSEQELKDACLKLADMGRRLYNAVFSNPQAQQYLRNVLDVPGTIGISQVASEQAVPWNALYDLPLLEEGLANAQGVRRQVCLSWAKTSHQKQVTADDDTLRLKLDYESCITAKDCPRQRQAGESDEAYRSRVELNVCVYGFIGFKHQLQQPPGGCKKQKEGRQNDHTLPTVIAVMEQPVVSVIGNRNIRYYPLPHQKALADLGQGPMQPIVRCADTLNAIRTELTDKNVHTIYFYSTRLWPIKLPTGCRGSRDRERLEEIACTLPAQ